MEKNLAIIQGLTSADQANSIRITDAGEVKIAATNAIPVIGSVYATVSVVNPNDPADQNSGINVPMGITEDNKFKRLELIDQQTYPSGVTSKTQKLLVDQAKSFGTVYSEVFDVSSAPSNDIPASITAAINQWTVTYGSRYDDLIITSYTTYTGTGAKFLVGVTIIRYY